MSEVIKKIKGYFKKPSLSFDRKLNAYDIEEMWKNKQFYELKYLLPKISGMSRQRSALFLFLGALAISIGAILHNPLLIFIGIGSITYGSEYQVSGDDSGELAIVALDSTHIVVIYRDEDNYYGRAKVGVISGTTITYGSEYTFNSASSRYLSATKIDSTNFVISYSDAGNSLYLTCIVGTLANGNELSFGSEYAISSAVKDYGTSVDLLDSTHFVVCWVADSDSKGYAAIGTLSGSTISYGSNYCFNNANTALVNTTRNVATLDSSTFVIAYIDSGNSSKGTAIIGTVSGSTISYGSEYVFNNESTNYPSVAKLSATSFVIAYRDAGADSNCIVGTISGTTITYGSAYELADENNVYQNICAMDATHFILIYSNADESPSNAGRAVLGTIANGNEISYGTTAKFNNAATTAEVVCKLSANTFSIAYNDGGDNDLKAIIGTEDTLGTKYQTCSDSIKLTNVKINSPQKTLSQSIKLTNVLEKVGTFYKTLTQATKISDSIIKSAQRSFSQSILLVGSMGSFSVGKLLSQSLKIADTYLDVATLYKTLSDAIKIADSIIKSFSRSISAIIKISGNAISSMATALSEAVKISDSILNGGMKVVSEQLKLSDSMGSFSLGKILSDEIALSDSILRSMTRIITEGIKLSGLALNTTGRSLSDSVGLEDFMGNFSVGKLLSDPIKVSDTIINTFVRTINETIKLSDELILGGYTSFVEAIKLSDDIISMAGKNLLESLKLLDSMGSFSVGKVLSEGIKIGNIILRGITRILTEGIDLSDGILKSLGRSMGESVLLDDHTLLFDIGKVLREENKLSDNIIKGSNRTLSESIKLIDSLIRSMVRTMTETIKLSDSILKSLSRSMSETLLLSDSILRDIYRSFLESVKLLDSIIRSLSRALSEVVKLSDTIIKSLSRSLSETIKLSGLLGSFVIGKNLTEAIKLADSIIRGMFRTFSDTIKITNVCNKGTSRTLTQTIKLLPRTLYYINGILTGLWSRQPRNIDDWREQNKDW